MKLLLEDFKNKHKFITAMDFGTLCCCMKNKESRGPSHYSSALWLRVCQCDWGCEAICQTRHAAEECCQYKGTFNISTYLCQINIKKTSFFFFFNIPSKENCFSRCIFINKQKAITILFCTNLCWPALQLCPLT